jgi:adenylate kinase
MMAARHGWRWLSSGQMLRDAADPAILAELKTGRLIDDSTINQIVFQAIDSAQTCQDIERVILDGYPRKVSQAQALTAHQQELCDRNGVSMCLVLELPKAEIMRRLALRGRAEDEPTAIERRLQIHRSEIYPILDYFNELNVPIAHVDGLGTVGEVHDRIEAELVSYGVVKD